MQDLKEEFSLYLKTINYDTLLTTQVQKNSTVIPFDLQSILNFSSDLFAMIENNLKKSIETLKPILSQSESFTPIFYNNPFSHTLRDLKTERLYKLTTFSAIVTRTSQIRPELHLATFECNTCRCKIENVVQKNRFTLPILCSNHLCKNRTKFNILLNESKFYDWQKIICQENNEETPPGTLPRNITLFCRDELCEKIKAGDKIKATGYLMVIPDHYVNLIGLKSIASNENITKESEKLNVKDLNYKLGFFVNNFELDEKECDEFEDLNGHEENIVIRLNEENQEDDKILNHIGFEKANIINNIQTSDNLYQKLAESLFPYIHGHSSIKQAILLMLAGGNSKDKNGIKLRGDINILLVGDPGTSKSQFLKQTSDILPRSVYTSGKSASAAGLTACVVRDSEGDYTIEAGALMLSDNGVCCIDEFDKMKTSDRVSIHEAMEQQTITINKAGINATLNARCCVLAAANPIHGRYDESKSLKGNINLSDPIMSRFDLYFVLIDCVDKEKDTLIASQILKNHTFEENMLNEELFEEKQLFSREDVKIYLNYVRKNIFPTISKEIGKFLVEKYIKLRHDSAINTGNYKITVRQLESLIRLSEAIAKIHCDQEVRQCYIEEAFRLIQSSVIEIKTDDGSFKIDLKESENDEVVSGTMYVSKKDYLKVVSTFIYILKTNENIDKENLICQYLEMRENFIESSEMFKKEQETAKYVLEHLLQKEGILYLIDDQVFIHPNYDA